MISSTLTWLGERWRDLQRWQQMLVGALPRRVLRLATVVAERSPAPEQDGEQAIHQLPPVAERLHHLFSSLFDLLGGPEAIQFVMHLGMRVTPLTAVEIAAIASVLGPDAIEFKEVRVAEGGILALVFRLNGGRAFATWHTMHLPPGKREDLSLLVHEATHVYQYERVGSVYIGEAIYAQRQLGRKCYDYGGPEGLEAGRCYRAFNREAQAQIAQDFYRRKASGKAVSAYLPYVEALRRAAF